MWLGVQGNPLILYLSRSNNKFIRVYNTWTIHSPIIRNTVDKLGDRNCNLRVACCVFVIFKLLCLNLLDCASFIHDIDDDTVLKKVCWIVSLILFNCHSICLTLLWYIVSVHSCYYLTIPLLRHRERKDSRLCWRQYFKIREFTSICSWLFYNYCLKLTNFNVDYCRLRWTKYWNTEAFWYNFDLKKPYLFVICISYLIFSHLDFMHSNISFIRRKCLTSKYLTRCWC